MSDQLPYLVERSIDGVEIRRYRPMVLVTVNGRPDDEAFGILFRYISGHNRPRWIGKQTETAMAGQKIPMTAPVISDGEAFSFVMPPNFSMDSTPEPLDARSIVERMPERLVAVLRFSGLASAQAVEARRRKLMDTLDKHELRYRGEPFLMRYNPPYMPGFMRRNEVGVELTPSSRSQSLKAA